MVVSCQTMPVTSYQLDTSELVELLQQSAVEHLTAFRQLEAQEFSSAEFSVCDYHNRLRGVLRVQMWRVSALFSFVYTKHTHADWWERNVICFHVSWVHSVDGWRHCLTYCTHTDCKPVVQRHPTSCFSTPVVFVAVSDDSVSDEATSLIDVTGSDTWLRRNCTSTSSWSLYI